MGNIIKLTVPAEQQALETLRAGDVVHLSGTVLTGRDAAHKRMIQLLEQGRPLPFEIHNQAIYYTGPCPAPPGRIIGSCGPTSSSRMDPYTPRLLDLGLKIIIGKGQRNSEVVAAVRRNKAVYLAAIGGAGALIAKCVRQSEIIAFDDLGPEAVYRMEMENFPLIVAIDPLGNNLFKRFTI
jgi:fumarate hydratase subunit beta